MKCDPLPCSFDSGCPENRSYPACDPNKLNVSKKCMKKVELKEIPLTKRYLEWDRKMQSPRLRKGGEKAV